MTKLPHPQQQAALQSSPNAHLDAFDDVTRLDPEERAASLIQRVYRGYRTRRELRGCSVAASTRWLDDMKNTKQKPRESPASPLPDAEPDDKTTSPARKNWERAVGVAMQASGEDRSSLNQERCEQMDHHQGFRDATAAPRTLGLEYFLEMVDSKHRHGSNLRAYHNFWKNSPTKENFFYWLDYGEGREIELPKCTREQLEKDQVRYLSPGERFNYLVKVDEAGLLRWAKDNELVETDNTRFKDSLHGVVRIEDDIPRPGDSNSSQSSSSRILRRDRQKEEPNASTREDYELGKAVKKFSRIRPAVIHDHFAGGRSTNDGMWIFVADTSFRIYIGIKEPGAFQHSSFLRGGRITAAGLIKTKNGQIRSLAPLSGHYRPHVANFRAFHHSLQDRGVDLSRVSITKSYAVLAGIEGYTLTKHKIRDVHEKLDEAKEKLHLMRLHTEDTEDSNKETT
ncbi:uncharacterized protein N7482_001660 [Penicillium canariense]|uniref:IQ calmodulin-binding motif protein n=1 Tax=Penicillium canariense TaxID=189055 RepID=A0A9W9IFJ8_9EURO|nr:uncharacterized protein N7482_001660 [Penicillium canariense]KAJ5175783.1 hypothetical protein N7482_001660 [Penicillium canariense]